jgi:hypothetical protein
MNCPASATCGRIRASIHYVVDHDNFWFFED